MEDMENLNGRMQMCMSTSVNQDILDALFMPVRTGTYAVLNRRMHGVVAARLSGRELRDCMTRRMNRKT